MPISTFLNGRPANRLRGLPWLSLSDTGHPVTLTVTSDSGGGGTQLWTSGGTVPCRIDPIADRGQTRSTGGAIDERSTHRVSVPADTPVSASDRFAVQGRGTFEITATHERTGAALQVFEVVETS